MSTTKQPTEEKWITTIDCGIGTIEFIEPDNLLLHDLMKNLESAIKKTTPRKVNEVLSNI